MKWVISVNYKHLVNSICTSLLQYTALSLKHILFLFLYSGNQPDSKWKYHRFTMASLISAAPMTICDTS